MWEKCGNEKYFFPKQATEPSYKSMNLSEDPFGKV